MTDNNAFERFVADHLADDGSGSAQAERLAALIDDRTSERRQRPTWLASITQPPMRTSNQLAVGSPTVRVAAIAVATMMLAVALAAVGAGAQRLMAANAQIIVAEDGNGDFRTISEAVAKASDGDRILVRSGTYRESVTIDKAVTLQGEGGRDAVILAFPSDSPGMEFTDGREGDPENPLVTFSVPTGIRLAADDIVLSDMTITGAYPGVAIAVDAGTADLSDLTVALEAADADEDWDPASHTRIALIVAEGADADLRRSTLDADVTALEGGSLTVEQSVLTGGDVSGDPESRLAVHDNVLTDAGIGSDGARAEIDGNQIVRGFIAVGGNGTYAVTDNHIDDLRYDVGPGIAISAWESGEVEITGNTVTNSDTGIKLIFFGGSAFIDGNTVESTRTGISVGGDKATVSNNTIEGSDIIGLEVYNTGPMLTGNSITGGGTGLHLATTDAATASDNTICDNRTNVRVVSGELPDLSGNDICEDGTD